MTLALNDLPVLPPGSLASLPLYSSSAAPALALPAAEAPAEDMPTPYFFTRKAAAARNARDINAVPTLGVSFGQTIGSLRIFVFAQDRSAEVGSVIYLHPSGHFLFLRFDYMMQAVPVYALHQPKYYNYDSVALTTERRTTFGVGLLPVGERMILNPNMKLQVALYANGGFAYFTRRILSEGATRFNIALQFGATFQYPVTHNSSILAGYCIDHLSNSNIHDKNPGLDANLVFVQYLVHLHRK
jgi:hypothetical protein